MPQDIEYSVVFSATLTGVDGSMPIGVGLIPAGDGTMVLATAAAMAASGQTKALGFTRRASSLTTAEVQFAGYLPPHVTGLGAGTNGAYVQTNATTAALERTPGNAFTPAVVGVADPYGGVLLGVQPPASGDATSIQGIDVDTSGASAGKVIQYNGSDFVLAVPSTNATQVQGVGVSASAPSSGQSLVYNGSVYAPATPSTNATQVQGVGVTVTGVTNGFVLAHNGSGFVARRADMLNVMDFGAVGNGVTDDGPAINAAIAAAKSHDTIYFPPPSTAYLISTTVRISDDKRGLHLLATHGDQNISNCYFRFAVQDSFGSSATIAELSTRTYNVYVLPPTALISMVRVTGLSGLTAADEGQLTWFWGDSINQDNNTWAMLVKYVSATEAWFCWPKDSTPSVSGATSHWRVTRPSLDIRAREVLLEGLSIFPKNSSSVNVWRWVRVTEDDTLSTAQALSRFKMLHCSFGTDNPSGPRFKWAVSIAEPIAPKTGSAHANAKAPVWTSGTKSLGQLVMPSVANGFWFLCTTAGTTGGGQPAWNATLGATTPDGGVTWTAVVDRFPVWMVFNCDNFEFNRCEFDWATNGGLLWFQSGAGQSVWHHILGCAFTQSPHWICVDGSASFSVDRCSGGADSYCVVLGGADRSIWFSRCNVEQAAGFAYIPATGLAGWSTLIENCDLVLNDRHWPYAGGDITPPIIGTRRIIDYGPPGPLIVRGNSIYHGGGTNIDYKPIFLSATTSNAPVEAVVESNKFMAPSASAGGGACRLTAGNRGPYDLTTLKVLRIALTDSTGSIDHEMTFTAGMFVDGLGEARPDEVAKAIRADATFGNRVIAHGFTGMGGPGTFEIACVQRGTGTTLQILTPAGGAGVNANVAFGLPTSLQAGTASTGLFADTTGLVECLGSSNSAMHVRSSCNLAFEPDGDAIDLIKHVDAWYKGTGYATVGSAGTSLLAGAIRSGTYTPLYTAIAQCTFTGSQTSTFAPFDVAEVDTSYFVDIPSSPSATTGGPSTGTLSVVKYKNGFQVTTTTAPGGSATATYTFVIHRDVMPTGFTLGSLTSAALRGDYNPDSLSAGSVTSWASDYAGTNHGGTFVVGGGTATAPTCSTGGPGGHKYVTFNGTTDCLAAASFSTAPLTNCTVILVWKALSGSAKTVWVTDTGSSYYGFRQTVSASVTGFTNAGNFAIVGSISPAIDAGTSVAVTTLGAAASASFHWGNVRVQGTNHIAASNDAGVRTIDKLQLGAQLATPTTFANFELYRFVVYDGILSLADMQRADDYLRGIYGISAW